MRVLDLFAGLKGWSEPFAERGHTVCTVELLEKFKPTICGDILSVTASQIEEALGGKPDIILASPPCTTFSMMTVGRNWTHDHQPRNEKAALALKLVEKTRALIDELSPRWFVIENPRAKLRKMPVMQDLGRGTTWYCMYGEKRAKPTDLFGVFPPSLVLRPMCKNGAKNPDGTPHHSPAPRGSYTGTQGMDSAESAKIPRELALDFCLAAEKDLGGQDGQIP